MVLVMSTQKNSEKVTNNHRQQQQMQGGGTLTCSDVANTNANIFFSNTGASGSSNNNHGSSSYGLIDGCDTGNSREMTKVVLTSNEAAWFVESWVVEYAIAYQQSPIVQRVVSHNDCCPATPASEQGTSGNREGTGTEEGAGGGGADNCCYSKDIAALEECNIHPTFILLHVVNKAVERVASSKEEKIIDYSPGLFTKASECLEQLTTVFKPQIRSRAIVYLNALCIQELVHQGVASDSELEKRIKRLFNPKICGESHTNCNVVTKIRDNILTVVTCYPRASDDRLKGIDRVVRLILDGDKDVGNAFDGRTELYTQWAKSMRNIRDKIGTTLLERIHVFGLEFVLSSVPQLFKQPLVQQVAEHIRKCSPDIGARISAQVLDEFLDILYSENSALTQSQSIAAAAITVDNNSTNANNADMVAQSNIVSTFASTSGASEALNDFKGHREDQTSERPGFQMEQDPVNAATSSIGLSESKHNCENDVPINEHVKLNDESQMDRCGDPEATENCTPTVSSGGQEVAVGRTHTSSVSLNQFSQHNKLRLEIQPFVPNNQRESDRSCTDAMYSAGINNIEMSSEQRNNSTNGTSESDLNKSNDSLKLDQDVAKALSAVAAEGDKKAGESKDAYTQSESIESPKEIDADKVKCQQLVQACVETGNSGNVSSDKKNEESVESPGKEISNEAVEEDDMSEQDARLVYSIPDVESDNLPTASVANRSFFLTDARMSKKFGTVAIQLNENGLQLMGLDVTPDAFDKDHGGIDCCNCKCANLEELAPHPADKELMQNLECAQLLIQETLAKIDAKRNSSNGNRRDGATISSSRSHSLTTLLAPSRVEQRSNREQHSVAAVVTSREPLEQQEDQEIFTQFEIPASNGSISKRFEPQSVEAIRKRHVQQGSAGVSLKAGSVMDAKEKEGEYAAAAVTQSSSTMPSYHNYQSIPSLPSSGMSKTGAPEKTSSSQSEKRSDKGPEKEKENSFNQNEVATTEDISKEGCLDIEGCSDEDMDGVEKEKSLLGETDNKNDNGARESIDTRKEESMSATQKQHMLHLEAIAKGCEQRGEESNSNGKKVAQNRSASPKSAGVIANLNILERSPRSQSVASLGKDHSQTERSAMSTVSPPIEQRSVSSSRKKKTPVKNNRSSWDLNRNSAMSPGSISMALPPYVDTALANSHKSITSGTSSSSQMPLSSSSGVARPPAHSDKLRTASGTAQMAESIQPSKHLFNLDSLKRDASGKNGSLVFNPITKTALSDKPRASLNMCNVDHQKKAAAVVSSTGPLRTENQPNVKSLGSTQMAKAGSAPQYKALSPTKKTLKRPLVPLGENKVDNDVRVAKSAKLSVVSPSKIKVNSMNLEITLKPLYFPENQTSMEYSEWVVKQAEFEKTLLDVNSGELEKGVALRGDSPSDSSFVSPSTVSLMESDASFYSCNQELGLTDGKSSTTATNASEFDCGRGTNSGRAECVGGYDGNESFLTSSLEKQPGKNGSKGTEMAYYYTGGNRRGDALVHIKPKPGKR